MSRHAAELVLRQLELADRTPELLALVRIRRRRLERGLRHPGRAPAGLQASGGEALHLQIEPLPFPVLLADQILGGDDPVLEAERERVHAAVARGRVGLPVQHTAARLAHLELVAREAVLRHDEEREPARTALRIGIGTREESEHVGAPGKRAPCLRAGDAPAAVRTLRAAADGRDVGAGVGLGHGDADHQLARGDRRQPLLLLRVGTALEQRLRQDLGSRDEASGGSEGRGGELLGDHDHHQVPHPLPAVLIGHGHAEISELRHLRDDRVGDEVVVAMDALGERRDFLSRERASRIARHLRHVAVDPRVVDAARADHLAADLTEARLVLRRVHRRRDRRRRERARERRVRDAEVVAMRLDQRAQPGRDLARERSRHAIDDRIGRAGVAPGDGVRRERLGRGGLGGRIREPLRVHLMVVDRFSLLRRPLPRRQRLVERGADSGHDGRRLVGHAEACSIRPPRRSRPSDAV